MSHIAHDELTTDVASAIREEISALRRCLERLERASDNEDAIRHSGSAFYLAQSIEHLCAALRHLRPRKVR